MNESTGEQRSSFLNRVRAALGRQTGDAAPPPPSVDPALLRLADRNAEPAQLFCTRARAAGMQIQRTHADQLDDALHRLLAELAPASALLELDASSHLHATARRVLDRLEIPLYNHERAMDAAMGIIDAHAALAESGTLIGRTDAGHTRLGSLAPPVHLALLPRAAILPDMLDYFASPHLAPDAMPSACTFITGPSKTADIEGELVTGVHGPARVIVLLIDHA